MDESKRNFLKTVCKVGGLAGLYSYLPIKEAEAFWGHQTLTSGETIAASYSTWLGKDQDGWTDSQANTNICLFDATGAGDDDYSTGAGLSGADLTFTESGAIVGAVGDPPYRQITGPGDYYTPTNSYCDLITGTSWSLITKLADLQNMTGAVDDFILRWSDCFTIEFQFMVEGSGISTDNTLQLYTNSVSTFTTDPIVTTGNIWLAIWRRSSGNIKFGFVTTTGSGAHGQPTKEGDFDPGKIADTGQAYSPCTTNWIERNIFSYGGANGITAKAYYMIVSTDCLIAA